MSTLPDQIVHLATEAVKLEPQPQDAAAVLIDAAAFCASQCGLGVEELIERVSHSHALMVEGKAAVQMHGKATTLTQ
jgi:hypothetical protein